MLATSTIFTLTQRAQCQDDVSYREREVLQLLSTGLTVKEVAAELFLSEHTIVSHKKNLCLKLKAKNAVHMMVKAIKLGYVHV